VRLARLHEILRLQDEITLTKNKTLEGSLQEVLVEGPSGTDPRRLTGRTRTNKIVDFPAAPGISEGGLLSVRVVSARRHSLEVEVPGEGKGGRTETTGGHHP
jgi:tRNA-2-methylthio-N6-dimethylallyladenosine synthase